jgi:hypothetical protein
VATAGKSDVVRDSKGRIDPHSVFYTGTDSTDTAYITGSQTGATTRSTAASILQGATNGTVGPQGGDAAIIMEVNTAGTVRINNLANLEIILNWMAGIVSPALLVPGTIFLMLSFRKNVAPIKSLAELLVG